MLYMLIPVHCLRYIVMFRNSGHAAMHALSQNDHVVGMLTNGFIGELEESSVERLRRDDNVMYIEADQAVHIQKYGTKMDSNTDSINNMNKYSNTDSINNMNKYSNTDSINNMNKYSNRNINSINNMKISRNNNISSNGTVRQYGGTDTPVRITGHSTLSYQTDAPWGISRISSGTHINQSHTFRYPSSAGTGVTVYVLDTGIETTHPELAGRATFGANFAGGRDTDENGHGTHCAGVIAGRHVGIARHARVVGVKVLNKMGSGMLSSVIMGIDYVVRRHTEDGHADNDIDNIFGGRHTKAYTDNNTDNINSNINSNINNNINDNINDNTDNITDDMLDNTYEQYIDNDSHIDTYMDMVSNVVIASLSRPFHLHKHKHKQHEYSQHGQYRHKKTVINMSVGGIRSKILEYAIKYASNLGIHISAAAGNDHEDACSYSPSSSKLALTAGASTPTDTVAFFSNYGECVDVYAPGVDIRSAWINSGYRIVSGTSMAAPHVTGVMALYLGERMYTPAELNRMLKHDAYRVVSEPGQSEKKYPLISVRKLLREIHSKNK